MLDLYTAHRKVIHRLFGIPARTHNSPPVGAEVVDIASVVGNTVVLAIVVRDSVVDSKPI